jgi:hypothetical protein
MSPPRAIRAGLLRLLVTGLCAAVGLPACATVGLSEARNEDVPVKRGRQEVPRDAGAAARVSQAGTALTVSVSRVCDVRETRTVRRTARRDRVNASPAADWVLGGLGVAAIGAGVGVYVDASNVHPRDDSSRQYNPVGADNARLLGGALVVTGAALASVAVVDVVRTSGEEEETTVVELPGETVDRGVPCKGRPLVGVDIALGLGDGKSLPIGRTDETGRLTVKLDEALQDSVLSGTKVPVLVGGKKAGEISVRPLRVALEEAAWKALYKEGCSNPQSLDACKAVEDFLQRYPDGKHAQRARLLLGEAAPALLKRRDEEAWKGVDPEACAKPKDLSTVERACAVVRKYLDEFPKGEHADAARAALKTGEPLVAKQRRREEQEATREAAEEERQQKAAERKERAEAEKAARKLRECIRRKCAAICKMKYWSQSSRDGCVELCVGSDQVTYMCEGAE